MKKEEYKLNLNGRELKVIINDLAEQASGSVLVQYGDTTVLATAVMSKQEREGIDFFPLSVEFEEKFYAAGKILGSRFMRREGKPSDEAILTARFVDRAIRPRFPKHIKREVQVVITCLSWDGENDPDFVGLIAASLALSISNIPWNGPIASLRLGYSVSNEKEGFILNPTYKQRNEGDLDLAFAGIKEDKNILINMIEAEAKEISEDLFNEAVKFALPHLEKIIEFQKDITKKTGKEKTVIEAPQKEEELENEINSFLEGELEKAIYQTDKTKQAEALDKIKNNLLAIVEEKYPDKKSYTESFLENKIDSIVHENILKSEKRPDGRKIDEVRKLNTEIGILPRTHGSGLFARGQTKALSILTLGSPSDVKLSESMEASGKKRFMHHYNFPPYCVGEVKPMRGPGRREIGHGMLAEKALTHLIPDADAFPYTIRIVTEILSSNGSSSMAAVSASSLALMDAGVPIKAPAAGIAMGLMKEDKGKYKILTDIQGPEDHYGDMDFKVAGTENGITAIQMDVKIEGIGENIFKETLEEARKARLKIIDQIKKTIPEPKGELSPYAPRIIILQINPSKIREVIGPGGKIINEIIAECGVSIDIEDTGKVFITSEKEESAMKATEWIKNLTREVRPGETFQGKVKRILDFGAFAEILPGQEGLIHISQLADYHVKKVEDIVKVGDIIPVKVISIDEQGRINLSLKEAKQNNNP